MAILLADFFNLPVAVLHADYQTLTATGGSGNNSENQNLAQILFFDKDLKTIVDRWPALSVELKRAIVKMVL